MLIFNKRSFMLIFVQILTSTYPESLSQQIDNARSVKRNVQDSSLARFN